jgi:hypothetical protein
MEGFFKDIQHLVESKDVSRKMGGEEQISNCGFRISDFEMAALDGNQARRAKSAIRNPPSEIPPFHPLNNVPSFAPMEREAAAMVNPRKIIAQTPRAAAR